LSSPLFGNELEDVCILFFVVRQRKDGLMSFDSSRTLASGSGQGVFNSLEYRPVNVVGPGAGMGGWAGRLRPFYTRGRRHEHFCPVTAITLRHKIKEKTVIFLI
jgi:hypothetical protein